MDVEGPGGRQGPGGPGFPGSLSGTIPDYPASSSYTIPGILHFIKNEWSRFEKERTNWEVQKAELQAKIAFFQGERKGHENLMHDLIRRIKMLEYALKQERIKLYKSTHGKDLVFGDMKPPEPDTNRPQLDISTLATQREESRKILRDYLREVGFPDNVLEARVARMTAYKNLYGQNQMMEQPPSSNRSESPQPSIPSFPSSTPPPSTTSPHSSSISSLSNGPIANGTDMQFQASSNSPKRELPPHTLDAKENEMGGGSEGDEMTAVFDAFEFLNKEDSDDEDDEGEEEREEDEDEEKNGGWESTGLLSFEMNPGEDGVEDDDMNTENAMDEFQEGSSMESESSEDRHQDEFSQQVMIYAQNKPRKKRKSTERPSRKIMEEYKKQAVGQTNSSDQQQATPPSSSSSASSPASASSPMGLMKLPGRRGRGKFPLDLVGGGVSDSAYEAAELGELAVISIEPEVAPSNVETSRKWDHKYTLQSHFDVVTSIAFHPTDQVVLTGSEDCTLKLWNLQRARQRSRDPRRSMLVDVESLHTLRGHRGPVLSVAFGVGGDSDVCYSGSSDSTIRVWRIPDDLGDDPFDTYDSKIHQGVLFGHTDAVWDLCVHPVTGYLLSSAADGSCRLWNHHQTSAQIREFRTEPRFGNPTSVDFIRTNMNQMVASYSASKIMTFDLETGQSVVDLDSGSMYDGTCQTQINKVVCHPTLPLLVSAHEDKYIKFFDVTSGKMIHYMTGHMDSVTGLAIDPHGLYLLSGGHDGSLRFWSMDTKMCIQEIGGAHRKRFDESIYNIASHSSEPFFASAGADGIAKVYI